MTPGTRATLSTPEILLGQRHARGDVAVREDRLLQSLGQYGNAFLADALVRVVIEPFARERLGRQGGGAFGAYRIG